MGQRLWADSLSPWRNGRISLAPPEAKKLFGYLSEQLRGREDVTVYGLRRCLAVYALAGAGHTEPAYHDLLFQNARASAEDRALVALALSRESPEVYGRGC